MSLEEDLDSDTVHSYSPSQIATFGTPDAPGCQRKWVFQSLLKVPAQQHRSAALGDEVHHQLEAFYKHGAIDYTKESGYIAAAALEHLPKPSEHLIVERKWSLQAKEGSYVYGGRVDLTDITPNQTPQIIDHKTSGNLAYAKTEEGLRKDPQGILYGWEGLAFCRVEKIGLFWNYVHTKKPYKTKPVRVTLEKAEVLESLAKLEESTVSKMAALIPTYRLKKKLAFRSEHVTRVVSGVEPNTSICEAYGGCPYKTHCTDIGAATTIRAKIAHETNPTKLPVGDAMSLKDRLAARAKDNVTTTPPATPPPVEGITYNKTWTETDPINPPQETAELTPEQQKAIEEASAPKVAEKPARKPRGPNKSKLTEEAPAPEAQAAPPDVVQLAVESTGDKIHTLYINCIPVQHPEVEQASRKLLAAARARVETNMDVADYRLADFGKGSAALVQEVLAGLTGKPGALIIDTGTPEGQLLVNPLSEVSTYIVRGLR